MKKRRKQAAAIVTAVAMVLLAASCGQKDPIRRNLISDDSEEETSVLLFAPMERSKPDVQNIARTAFDKTVIMAEEQLDVRIEYNTYTAKDYQEKSYDDVSLDRIRHGMDDFYLLNPDVLQKMGEEGRLADLSGLDCAKNLREVVRLANTVDGKLVGIPQEVVVYGLFVNKDMFDRYKLKLPNTPEEFLDGNKKAIRRNKLITGVLYYSKDMETFATGLKRIKDLCDKAGCKVEFRTEKDDFVVIFYRNLREIWEKESERKSAENPKHQNDVLADVLEDVLGNQIIHLLTENNKLNQKQIAASTGKSIASVQRTMKQLSEQGRITREGGKRFGHWKVK